jgi:hypothetical protein
MGEFPASSSSFRTRTSTLRPRRAYLEEEEKRREEKRREEKRREEKRREE